MKLVLRLSLLFAFATAWLGAAETPAASYKIGDVLPGFTVTDAKENSYTYTPGDLDTLVVSFSMSPGKSVNGYLAQKPADYLEQHRAAFIANIHGMPGIGRFFALPKMKKYPHRILLGDSEELLAKYPSVDGKIAVISLDKKGAITAIRQLDPEKELDQLFPAK